MTGRQEPTFEVVDEWQETNGGEAVELFESYGFRFDHAQRREMDIYLARIDGKACGGHRRPVHPAPERKELRREVVRTFGARPILASSCCTRLTTETPSPSSLRW